MVLTQNGECVINTARPLTDHLVSGCPILAPTEYLNWHDRLSQYIHWCLCKNFCQPHERNWWEHKLPKVIENKSATFLWDFNIHIDRAIQGNRPEIVVKIIMIKHILVLTKVAKIECYNERIKQCKQNQLCTIDQKKVFAEWNEKTKESNEIPDTLIQIKVFWSVLEWHVE